MRFEFETWRKVYVAKPASWLRLSVSARGLGRELLTYCDDEGRIDIGEEIAGVAIAYLLGARPIERKRIRADVEELIEDGYLSLSPKAVTIRNFVSAQTRSTGAVRAAKYREKRKPVLSGQEEEIAACAELAEPSPNPSGPLAEPLPNPRRTLADLSPNLRRTTAERLPTSRRTFAEASPTACGTLTIQQADPFHFNDLQDLKRDVRHSDARDASRDGVTGCVQQTVTVPFRAVPFRAVPCRSDQNPETGVPGAGAVRPSGPTPNVGAQALLVGPMWINPDPGGLAPDGVDVDDLTPLGMAPPPSPSGPRTRPKASVRDVDRGSLSDAAQKALDAILADAALAPIVPHPGQLARDLVRIGPGVNVGLEVAKAGAWLRANPKQAKKNGARFLTNWVSREQERGPRSSSSAAPWARNSTVQKAPVEGRTWEPGPEA